MTVVETLLTFVVAPAAIYGGMALWVSARRRRRPRYRPGEAWPYDPLFWTANPEGAALPAGDTAGRDARGGTSGSW